jgi:hypothetical protein
VNDFLYRLASAIATAEGFFTDGTLPRRDNNPGDLRAAPWLIHPVIVAGFWNAASVAEGIAGIYHQLALDIARGWTLRELISAWAPETDGNNTENYIKETARRVGLTYYPPPVPGAASTEPPLWNYLTIAMIA